MTAQWGAAAHRGELALTVVTPLRAIEERYPIRDDCAFFALAYPDHDKPFAINFLSIENLANFLREMKPRHLLLVTAQGENPLALRDALDLLAADGAAVH